MALVVGVVVVAKHERCSRRQHSPCTPRGLGWLGGIICGRKSLADKVNCLSLQQVRNAFFIVVR